MFKSKKDAIQFIKDNANGKIYWTYCDELQEWLGRIDIFKLMKKYNVEFTESL